MSRASLIVAAVLAVPMAMAQSETRVLTGSVSHRERIALPKDAQVSVVLEDTSIADRAATPLGQAVFATNGKQSPFPFSITYRSDQVQPGRTYSVRARITVGGQLMFTSTGLYSVKLDGTDLPVSIVVQKTAPPATAPQIENSDWIPYEIRGVKMIEGGRDLSLTFDRTDHKFGAFVGVNQIGGTYELNGNQITFKDIFSTLMAGPSELMEQESRFKKALEGATKAKVFGDKLVIYKGDNAVIKASAKKP